MHEADSSETIWKVWRGGQLVLFPPQRFVCASCGKTLLGYKSTTGRDVSVREHMQASVEKFGQPLCLECIQKYYPQSKPA